MKQSSLTRRAFLRRTCMFGAGALCLAGAGTPFSVLAAIPAKGQTEQQTRLLMGTMVSLAAVCDDPSRVPGAFAAAFAEMERLIAIFDRHTPSSAISILNSQGSLQAAPTELSSVLHTGLQLGKGTAFAFNPAILPALELYEKHGTDNSPPHFDHYELGEALALAKPGEIDLSNSGIRFGLSGMRITLDGIAKGFIADAASDVLSAHGLSNHMINAGGDIRVHVAEGSKRPWTIGIRHPEKTGEILATVRMTKGGIATSGNYEKAFNRSRSSHHLINHATGKSPDIASLSVQAENAMQADALATALSIMPPSEALRYVETKTTASCLIVDRFGRRFASSRWG